MLQPESVLNPESVPQPEGTSPETELCRAILACFLPSVTPAISGDFSSCGLHSVMQAQETCLPPLLPVDPSAFLHSFLTVWDPVVLAVLQLHGDCSGCKDPGLLWP